MLIGVGIGVVLAPFAILFQDVELSLSLVLTLLMFVTPVLYPPPTTKPGMLMMTLNPISPVLDTTRAWLLSGQAEHLAGLVVVGMATILLVSIGWVLYRLALPIVIERMGA